jgi:uncharacterized membrane protein
MRSYWQSTWLGWTMIATMFAVAIVESPFAPVSIPTHWNGAGSVDRYGGKFQGLLLIPLSAAFAWGLITARAPLQRGKSDPAVSRALIRLGYAILLIFIGVFSDLVLWINGVVLNMNYLLLPALLLMCAALGNLLLRALQKGRGSALPG